MDTIHPHMDGAESAFFLRELEHVHTKTFDIVYPDLMGRSLVPVNTEAHEGSETVTYQQYDRHGKAKIVGSKAKDVPRGDVNGIEFTRPVRRPALSYAWDVDEVKAAAMAGKDLNPRRANANRRGVEEVIDEIAAVGDADNGIASGLLNDAGSSIDAATGNWSGLTATQILTDVSASLALMATNTLGVERALDLILPPEQFERVQNLERSTGSDMSVKDWIEKVLGLRVTKWHKATAAGAGSVDRAVLYTNSPEKLHQDITVEYTTLPVQAQGMELVVIGFAKTAGTKLFYPRSCRYIDGI
jgi:hypothetical protein